MTKKLYITFALLGSLLITSCDSFLDIQPIGKVIPNTGAGTTITIGIAATIALLGIAAVGLKKYKDVF